MPVLFGSMPVACVRGVPRVMEVPRSERTVKVPLPAPVLDCVGCPLLRLTRKRNAISMVESKTVDRQMTIRSK